MIDLNGSWWEQPIVLVTISPLRKNATSVPVYDRFSEIGMARLERGAITDSFSSFVMQRGPFFCVDAWEVQYVAGLMASDYRAKAPAFASLLDDVSDMAEGAVPAAVAPTTVKPLLHACLKNAEKKRGSPVDRSGRFALRPQSRWLDLRAWRKAAGVTRSFPGPLEPPVDRLAAMAKVLCEVSDALALRGMSIAELMAWQEGL